MTEVKKENKIKEMKRKNNGFTTVNTKFKLIKIIWLTSNDPITFR